MMKTEFEIINKKTGKAYYKDIATYPEAISMSDHITKYPKSKLAIRKTSVEIIPFLSKNKR